MSDDHSDDRREKHFEKVSSYIQTLIKIYEFFGQF